MTKYEVLWQISGTKTIKATNENEAFEKVDDWLESSHSMTVNEVDGWEYEVIGTKS